MKIKRFVADDIREAMRMVKEELGNDAVIMSNRSVDGRVEIIAAKDFDEQLVHENIKKQQQQKRTEAARKSAELASFDLEKQDGAHIIRSNRKEEVLPSRQVLKSSGTRSKLEEYVGYAEKVNRVKGDVPEGKEEPEAFRVNKKIGHYESTLEAENVEESPELSHRRKRSGRASSEVEQIAFKMQSKRGSRPVSDNRLEDDGLQQTLLEIKSSMASATSDMLQEVRQEMRQELRKIKSSLEAVAPSKGVVTQPDVLKSEEHKALPVRLELLRRLASIGMSKTLSIKVANRLSNHKNSDVIWTKALDMLKKVLPIGGGDLLKKGGVVALVGPTGVGKTTTIAKLAAQFILHYGTNRDVALITMDNYRIGAHEQLSIYGRILDIPVRVASDAQELQQLVEGFSSKRLVLIDTAGVSQRDHRMLEQMHELQESGVSVNAYLVMSATTQLKAMAEIIEGFSIFEAKACILTKMDETAETGNAVSTLIEAQLPLSFITNGQQVPEDIQEANAVSLIKQCLVDAKGGDTEPTAENKEWLAAGYA